jgi:signal transduction histidine kinase/CheY-like chemotaxis protein
MNEGTEPTRALVAALAFVAGVDSVLQPEAFASLAALLRDLVGPADFAITRPEGPGAFRVLASTRAPDDSLIPVRTLLSSSRAIFETVYVERRPYVVRDLAAGNELEQATLRHGFEAAAAFPVLDGMGTDPAGGTVFAALVVAFPRAEDVDSPRLVALEEVARVLGPSVRRGLEARSVDRASRILEATEDALVAWDAGGIVTDVNPAMVALLESPRGDILGTSIREIFGVVPTALHGGQRLRVHTRDGRRLTVSATVSAIAGDPLALAHAMLRDMSDVVAAEQDAAERLAQLHEVTEQHMVLLDNAPLLIFRIDPESHEVLYLNRHAEHLFGVPAAQALAITGFLRDAHIDAEGATAFEEAVILAKLGQIMPPYEARLRRSDADPIVARGTIYPIMNDAARVVGVEGILLDVTAERMARSRLLQADRLATVGLLAAGVAHEINNPAAFMLLGLDLLQKTLAAHPAGSPIPETVASLIADLRDTSRRIVDIARDLRTFASPAGGRNTPSLVDVTRSIESALTITRAQIMEKANVEKDLEPDLPAVAMEEGRLGQVLVNLLMNAAQAVAEGKRLRGGEGIDKVRVTAHTDADQVVITIADTGPGVRPELVDRIFAPFYTTKQQDHGTGLGLAISKTLVEGASGTLTVESPGDLGGAAFTIRLPRARWVEDSQPEPPPLPEAGRGRVLIVEDEELLGKILWRELARVHEVALCSSGEEALQYLASEPVDVVLCDLKMPGMGGEEFFRAATKRHPELSGRFVFMTGVGFAPELTAFLEEAQARALDKPFTVAAALGALAEILGKPPGK